MNKQGFLEYVIPKVEPLMTAQGFTYKKSKAAFVKLIDDGWIQIPFSFYQFALTVNFNSGFQLRKHSVQEILVKYIKMNPGSHKTSPTLSFSLTGLARKKDPSFRDTSFHFVGKEQLDDVLLKEVFPFLENLVPYFSEKYNDLTNLYSLLTNKSEEYNSQIRPTYYNYIAALVIGRMIFPERFDHVVITISDLFLKIKSGNTGSFEVNEYEETFENVVSDLIKMPFSLKLNKKL